MSASPHAASPITRAAAVVVAVLIAALIVVAIAMFALPWPAAEDVPTVWFTALFSGVAATFGFVGAVLAYRLPGNALGWFMAFVGLAAAVVVAGSTYGLYDTDLAGRRAPLGELVMWVSSWLFNPALIGAVVFVPLLFPSGRLPSRRWRWFAAVAVVAILLVTLRGAFLPWSLDQFPHRPNPFELHGTIAGVIAAGATLSDVTGAPAMSIVLASVVIRFRRARGTEREQFKWFGFAAGITVALVIVSNLLPQPFSDAVFVACLVSAAFVPVSIGIAVLRYRLYDIDLVINRTLVYGSLSLLLAAIYAVLVLGFESVLGPLMRADSLAVAASTLVVAALFQPARGRVQTVVDRRFYRHRYDASREVAGFGARLRDEVEPQRLAATIVATLERTVEPTTASIWLRGGGGR